MATVQGEWKKKSDTSATYSIDGKVVATVSGLLKNGFSVSSEYGIDGIIIVTESDTKKGSIQFSPSALTGTSKVTIASSNGYDYTATLASNVSKVSFEEVKSDIAEGTTNTLTITGNVVAGYMLATDAKSISYVASGDAKTLAKLEKLSTDASEDNVKINGTTITLSKDALPEGGLSLKSDYGYKLAFDSTVEATKINPDSDLAISGGKGTLKGTLTAGYTLSSDGKTVTYTAAKTDQTLATISGLGTEALTGNVNFDKEKGVITLSKDALKNANVTLKLSNGADYKLALEDADDLKPQEADPVWSYSNGTATYKQITSEGWTLNGDAMGVTYAAQVTDTFATVKGLAKLTDDTTTEEVDEIEKAMEGITASGTTITINDPDLLTTGNVTVTAGKGHDAYTLKLGDKIPTESKNEDIWAVSGTTAVWKNVDTAYYSESGSTVKYNKEANAKTLATVKGLASGVTADDLSVNGTVITLTKGAVGTKNVTVGAKDGYTLAFDKGTDTAVPTPSVKGGSWTVNQNAKAVTSLTYSGTLTPGFRLSADEKTAIYIGEPKSGNPLITISGTLNKDASGDDFKVNDETGVITVEKGALGTSNVTVKEAGYSLAFNSEDMPYTDDSGEVLNGMDVWRVNGSTATYKKVIPAYYTINDKGAIVYHKEVDVKGETYATIKGLDKTKLAENFRAETNTITGISLDKTTGVITLTEDVLANSNATLTATNYTLKLDDNVKAPKPDDEGSWTISNTTATYKGNVADGWTQTNEKLITYSKDVNNGGATLAVVKGLDKTKLAAAYNKERKKINGLDATRDGKIVVSDADLFASTNVTVEGLGGYTFALDSGIQGDSESTTVKKTNNKAYQVNTSTATYRDCTSPGFTISDDGKTLAYSGEDFTNSYFMLEGLNSSFISELTAEELEEYIKVDVEDPSKPVITLSEEVLGGSKVTLTTFASSYSKAVLDLDPDDDLTAGPTDGEVEWTIDPGIAYLRTYTKESYAVASDRKSITYTKPTDPKKVATITGLDTKALQNAMAVNKDDENSIYNLLNADIETETSTNTKTNVTTEYATGKGTITVDDKLLSKNTVTITNEQASNYDYKLKLADTEDGDGRKRSTVTDGEGWTLNNTTANYEVVTTEGYYIPDADEYTNGVSTGVGTSIVYNTKGTVKTSISNVKSANIKFELVDGETVDKPENRTGRILVGESALGTATIKLSNPKGYNYTLAFADDVPEGKSNANVKLEWAKANNATKATYQRTIAAESFTEDGTALTYYPKQKSVVSATLNGINSAITYDTLNKEDNGYIEIVDAKDGVAGTITILSRDALGTGNVTVGTKENYTVVLSDDVDFKAQTTAARLNYDSKSGKTTIATGTTAGWEAKLDKNGNPDGKTILYTKPNLNTLATISGLKPGLTDEYSSANGTLTGLTFNTGSQTITVAENLLNGKNISLGSKDSYSISLANPTADGVAVENIDDDPYWEFKNGKATLVGGTTAGYEQNGSKTIKYVKAVKKTLATISGLITDAAFKKSDLYEDGNYELGVSDDGKSIGRWQLTTDENGKKVRMDEDEDGAFTPYITLNDKTHAITFLSSEILNDATAKLAITKGVETNYALAIGKDFEAESKGATYAWQKAENATKATYELSLGEGYSVSNDKLSLVYTKADPKPTVLATLTGLTRESTADDLNDETKNLITVTKPGDDGSAGTITINAAALGSDEHADGKERVGDEADSRRSILGKSNLSLGKNDNYTLEISSTKAFAPTTDSAYWDLSTNGSAIYKQATSEGWTKKLDSKGYWDGKTYVYTKAATANLATVGGLYKRTKNEINDDVQYYQVKGSASDDSINYNTTVQASTDNGGTWTDLFSVASNRVITFTSDATLPEKGKVTVKSGDKTATYNLAVDSSIAPQDFNDPKPYLSGTTVTLKNAKTPGWVVDEKTKTTMSRAGQTNSDDVAIIEGLKKGLKTTEAEEIKVYGSTTNSPTISIPKSALGTTDIVLTDKSNSGYTFREEKWITKDPDGDAKWTISKGSATLAQKIGGGYEISTDGKKISYTAEKTDKNANLVTIAGLNKDVSGGFTNPSDASKEYIYFNTESNTITINNNLLGTSKITAKSTDKNVTYTLALGDDVVKADDTAVWKDQTEWATSKGTATYKTYDKPYYSVDNKTGAIVYNKESKGTTYMTVSGLNTAASLDSGYTFNPNTKTITIDSNGVTAAGEDVKGNINGKNITLKITDTANYSGYKLALDTTDTVLPISETVESGDWNNAKLTGTITAGYSLTNDKTITCIKKDQAKNIASITGLKANSSFSYNNGVVTLSEDVLNAKDVVLTTSLDSVKAENGNEFLNYTFELGNVNAPTVTSGDSLDAVWSTSKSKAVLKGVVSEGYILSASKKSVTYTAATKEGKTSDLVTISGLTTGKEIAGSITASEAEGRKLTIDGSDLTNKVTVTGGVFEVDFDKNFNNASLVGSAKADSISVAGSEIIINTGKGDDYVYLGGSSNTFIYASGDGNDVVADFTQAGDKIKVTKGTVTSVETVKSLNGASANDVLIKVDGTKGSIRLKAAAGKQITILDAKDNSQIYVTESAVSTATVSGRLLESDNFTTTTPQLLSDLVSSGSDYTVGSLDTAQDLTSLDKQSDVITYSGDK